MMEAATAVVVALDTDSSFDSMFDSLPDSLSDSLPDAKEAVMVATAAGAERHPGVPVWSAALERHPGGC